VVTEVNGKRVTTAREFSVAVGNLPVGTKARVKLLREGKAMDVEITVAKRKSAEELAKQMGREGNDPGRDEPSTTNKAGLALRDLTPELRRQLGLDAGARGVVVFGVQPDGAAAMSGLQRGDLITEINRRPVRNVSEANRALNTKAKSIVLRVARGQMNMIVVLDLGND
jgi:serine protease Do